MSTRSLLNAGAELTRIASTEEFVGLDSPHWAVEPYIPVNTAELIRALLARRGDWKGADRDAATPDADTLLRLYGSFADLLHHRYRPLFSRFAQRYAALDPDRDTLPLAGAADAPAQAVATDPRCAAAAIDPAPVSAALAGQLDRAYILPDPSPDPMYSIRRITAAGRVVLEDAAYTEVERGELEQAVGSHSHWGVPLHVDFDVFDAIAVYARGDVVGRRAVYSWRHLYRQVFYDVSLYQRVVVMFKLRKGYRTEDDLDDTMLHLRMFKNVPKQDIDMLLPGTRVKFTWLDHIKTLAPLGGIGITLFKIIRIALFLAAITLSMAVVLTGLCLALVGYLIRGVMNRIHAKNRYMLNLTRSLYYQKLDSNAGVACRLLDEAESQRHREVVLAYHALISAGEPISQRRLRRRCERIVRELAGCEIAFRADDAIALLDGWGLILRSGDSKLGTEPPGQALQRVTDYWQQSLDA